MARMADDRDPSSSLFTRLTGLELRRVRARDSKPERRSASNGHESPLPPAHLPLGAAVSTNFFDTHPRFFETSETSAKPVRLNLRHQAIFEQHAHVFDGASVLDIASHDGRWTLAALHSGARHVIGVEAREELISNARSNLRYYGVAADSVEFLHGDVFDVLRDHEVEVDVVLCLGFLYHTLRYNELMKLIVDCKPAYLLIDTDISKARRPFVRVRTERVSRQGNAVADRYSVGDRVLSGLPSEKAVASIVGAYGFEVVGRSDWAAILRDNESNASINDYRKGERATYLCRWEGERSAS